MRFLIYILIFLFFHLNSYSQSDWIKQSVKEFKKIWFWDVACLSKDIVVAVGLDGYIIRTVDGGAKWQIVQSNVTNDLSSIYFADDNTGWIVGENGIILNSVDKGASWNRIKSITTKRLYDVHFINADTGWVVGGYYIQDHINEGGVILKTTDGGKNWVPQTVALPSNWLNRLYLSLRHVMDGPRNFSSVFFTDYSNGYIVGTYGTILKTTNSGENWIPQESGTTRDLDQVFFINNNVGWAVGMTETILKTIDGGSNWRKQMDGSYHYSSAHHFNYLFFVDDKIGWTGGINSAMLKTTDGGINWKYLSPVTGSLSGIYFIDERLGWVVGERGKILKTFSGGK